MSREKKSDGKGRPFRLHMYVPKEIFEASAMDRETGRLNDKLNRVLQVLYANGGRTDSLEILIAEEEAEISRRQAMVASLKNQREAAEEAQATEVRIERYESEFIAHVDAFIARSTDKPDWKSWLHAGRADVKAIGGMGRAKQLLKSKGIEL